MTRTWLIALCILCGFLMFVAVSFALAQHGQPVDARPNLDRLDDANTENVVSTILRRSVIKPKTGREAGTSPEDALRIDDNCLWGLPKKIGDVGPTVMICRDGYVLEHSSDGRIPLWVCEHCTVEEISSSLPRTNPFRPDPLLVGMPRAELADYRGSGLDRGHMAPNGNQTIDDRLRRETFFLSNIVPQVGEKFNQSIWAKLEDQARQWTRTRRQSWIITGAIFYESAEEDPATADGLIEISVIGENQVAVPTHLFKIVVAQQLDDTWESIAFVMKNEDYDDSAELKDYIESIDWIEDHSGFDFLPEAKAETGDPEIEAKLEARRAAMWN